MEPTNEIVKCCIDSTFWQTIIQALTFVVAVCGGFIAYKQLKANINAHNIQMESIQKQISANIAINHEQLNANHEWNRRHFAMQEVTRIRVEAKAIRDRLTELTRDSNSYLIQKIKVASPECSETCKLINNSICIPTPKFADRFLKGGTLAIHEVHNWVCKYTCADGKPQMVQRDIGEVASDCEMTENGELIRSELISLINLFEEFAVGIKTETIDENIAKSLYRAPIIKTYTFFKEYIKHLTEKHDATNFAVNLKWLYDRWEDKNTEAKLNKTA